MLPIGAAELRPARLANGGGIMVPGLAAAIPGAAAAAPALLAGAAEATWLKAGAAVAQFCGTDKTPSVAARPTPALTAVDPIVEVKMPLVGPVPPVITDPNTWLPNIWVTGVTERISALAEPSEERPEAGIVADDPADVTKPVPDVSAVEDVVKADTCDVVVEDSVVDESVEATPVLDTALDNGVVDSPEVIGVAIDVNWDTTCPALPAPMLSA